MDKQVKIRIFPDGTINAEIEGIKGKRCTNYIKMIEELLKAETHDSETTWEYNEPEDLNTEVDEKETIQNKEDVI